MTETTIPIAEIFARDPLERSAAEFEALIEHYRKNRHTFNSAAMSGAKPRESAKAMKGAAAAAELGVDLDELKF